MKRPLYLPYRASEYVNECRADALQRLSGVRAEHDGAFAFGLLFLWIAVVISVVLCSQ